jgi:hypothetical protein
VWLRSDNETSKQRHEMDGGQCQVVACWAMGIVHHIKARALGGTTHNYTINEKVTLCAFHHAAIHDRGLCFDLRDGRRIGPRGEIKKEILDNF